jgi:glycosyltransferase involved in cell wall biosynthesis
MPALGIWVERIVRVSTALVDPTVIAPVPYVPPGIPVETFARYRRIERRRDNGFAVHYPRIPVPPGHLLHEYEARLAYPTVRRLADALHRAHPFDLIHAHFVYPEAVMGERLARRYGIPVLCTEHAAWLPWLDAYPRVRRQVLRALPQLTLVTALSEAARRTIVAVAGSQVGIMLLPEIVDDEVFTVRNPGEPWDPNQILFVGAVRRVKGLDVLARAFALLHPRRPSLRLTVVGEPFLPQYRRDEHQLRQLVDALGLRPHVHFAGLASPSQVAATMRQSALLVVPSRRESFSAVAAEALACGTPVVATRCGGPEDIVTADTGRLVAVDDPDALARGIDDVLAARSSFDPEALRRSAVSRFGRAAALARLRELYERGLASRGPRASRDAVP